LFTCDFGAARVRQRPAIGTARAGHTQPLGERHATPVARDFVPGLAQASDTLRNFVEQLARHRGRIRCNAIAFAPALSTIRIRDITPCVVAKFFVDVSIAIVIEPVTALLRDRGIRIAAFDQQRGTTTRDTERHENAVEHQCSSCERCHTWLQAFRRDSVHTRFL
jgi:hypothetical protein